MISTAIALLVLAAISTAETLYFGKIVGRWMKAHLLIVAGLFALLGLEHVWEHANLAALFAAIFTAGFKILLIIRNRAKMSQTPTGYLRDAFAMRGWLEWSGQKKTAKPKDPNPYQDFISQHTLEVNGILVIHFDGTIKYVNQSFAEYLDTTPEQLEETNYISYLSKYQKKRSEKAWIEARESREKTLRNWKNIWTIDGKQYAIHWKYCYNDNEQQVACCVIDTKPYKK